ncbi:ENT domain-containing protein/Agenet domain-containing protein [Cephalotus follicularis]|uniref:ENT domain-containing protein/Agenet domain-containing protein n=1 Tax=Cephalotus follicularis TaxID=3775 RepID=A0A1Q3BRE9_CEPFO|nr:ENT domain-containing protein/Agenet domain-containing protein [Cephalotus follicularis]
MRFKKGNRVEVLSTNEVSSGAWRCAVIVASNGHNYTVKYDCSLGMINEAMIERVSRNLIRPFPPPAMGVEGWKAGDVVEVFDDFSWKIATVLKVMRGNYYLVRIVGSLKEFQVHKVKIRVRQSWKDDKWVVIGKGSGSFEVAKSIKISSNSYQVDARLETPAGDDCLAAQNSGFQESHIVSARTLKRASAFCPSYAESSTEYVKKFKAIQKESEHQQVVSGYPSTLMKKVDAVAYPQEYLGKTYMHVSSNYQANGFFEMGRRKTNPIVECSLVRPTEANDSDIDACSVASCSVSSNSTYKFNSLAGISDGDTLSSDAESFNERGDEEEKSPYPIGEDIAARIHRIELHAYHCTLKALYASGPLSWEQKALLTNLRISLHVSNNEHFTALRNLISTGTSFRIS